MPLSDESEDRMPGEQYPGEHLGIDPPSGWRKAPAGDGSGERISPTPTWTIHVCPRCGLRIDLRLRRAEDVRCYGFAGNHPGTPVEAVVVAEVPHEA